MIIEKAKQGLSTEDIDAHRGQIGLGLSRLGRETKTSRVNCHLLQGITLGLFAEFLNRSVLISAHETKRFGLLRINWQSSDGEVSARLAVMLHKQAVIHAIELIPRQDQVLIHIPFLEQPLILTNSICSSFEPGRTLRGLLSSENLNKTLTKASAEVVGLREVPV